MKLLAWDSSSKVGAIAALEWKPGERPVLVAEWTLNVEATHSDNLLWAIHQTLHAARWKLAELDLIGVGVGPGSFTGLRIGMTTARTLAHTLDKPLIGVSSLAALARPVAIWNSFTAASTATTTTKPKKKPAKGARTKPSDIVVVASTDASKGELFALWGYARSIMDCVVLSSGEDDTPGLWKRGVEEKVITPDELVAQIRRKLSERSDGDPYWIAVGEGRDRYPESWKKLPLDREIQLPSGFLRHVQGRTIGMMAWEAYQAGLARPALEVHPRYLRASDAEIKLKAGLLPKGPTRG